MVSQQQVHTLRMVQMCGTHWARAGMLLVDKQAVTSGFMGRTIIPPQPRIQGVQPASYNTSMESIQQDLWPICTHDAITMQSWQAHLYDFHHC